MQFRLNPLCVTCILKFTNAKEMEDDGMVIEMKRTKMKLICKRSLLLLKMPAW